VTSVREGSFAELEQITNPGAAPFPEDPRVDRAFKMMRGEDASDQAASSPAPAAESCEERARRYRAVLLAALTAACEVVSAARADGVSLAFALDRDAAGRLFVKSIESSKPLGEEHYR
jgi:hypothetical protein